MAKYQVKQGDTLSKIAQQYGIKDYNTIKTRSGNPNLIYASETLDLPDTVPQTNIPPTSVQKSAIAPITAPQKPILPQPMQSLTTTGQNFIKARTDANKLADELTIKQEYRDRGFEEKYGSWVGSNEQYKAMHLQDIQDSITQMNERIAKEGITDNQGQVLQQPNQPPAGEATVSNAPTEEFKEMTVDDYNKMTDDILADIGTTDLSKLIQEFSGGELTTPELELSKEDRDAQLADLKTAAAQGLATIQKGLASRGMTFSGIRTQAEADQAAEVLSKESGINREFAGKIISAARQEQSRREKALTAAEDNYNKALEAQGYVYNPITNTIEKTMARTQFEYGVLEDLQKAGELDTQIVNSGGNIFEYNKKTGEMSLLYEAPEKETNLNLQYFTDDSGNVTKVATDPSTGKEVSRTNLGKLGKTKTPPGSTTTQWEYDAGIWQWLSGEGADLSDEDKAQQIKQLGRNPEDFGLWGY